MRNILPTLNEEEQKVQLELYKEICTSWRALVDVRFKLLGLVPTASIAIIIVLLTSDTNGLKLPPILISWTQTGIALFGLIVTYGLYVYDKRNTQFHNYLKNQGSRIEKILSADTGQFSKDSPDYPEDKLVLSKIPLFDFNETISNLWIFHVKHSTGINLIYGAAIISWILAIAIIWINWYFY